MIEPGALVLLLWAAIFGIFIVGVLVLLGAVAIRIARGGKPTDTKSTEEARLMQEIYIGLEKLNDRVESLETIMLDEREPKNLV